MKQTNSSYSTPDGLALFTREWLPETSPDSVFLLVHGLGEHSGRYQHVAEFLTSSGSAVIGFDLRGHGKSDGSRGHAGSYDLLMDDITHFIDQARVLFPGIPLFLYGHSLGGNLVLYYLINHKPEINGAVVTSPGLVPAIAVPAWKVALGKILYSLLPTFQMENGLDISGLSRDQSVIDTYVEDPYVHSKVSARLGLDIINNGTFIIDHAGEIMIPLLLMVGTADRVINPSAVRQFSEKAIGPITYREWENFYHELHNEPEKLEVLKTILEWKKIQCSKNIGSYLPK